MIRSFADRKTKRLFNDDVSPAVWQSFHQVACRKLDMLDAATALRDLRSPPGNRLKALSRERKGKHSIRINDQWRVCFRWTKDGPEDVEITDYH